MDNSTKTKKKSNKAPLFTLLGFLLVSGVFVYFLIKPSTLSTAIDDVNTASNIADVHFSWEKNKSELSGDEDYLLAVRTKLASLNLTQQQTEDCLKWLPKPPQSLNIIVVPDLSGRINDEVNNPSQAKNDTVLLNEIWKSFEASTRLKMNSQDRLILDVTGGNQAQGSFRSIANNMIFDLSNFKDKSNKLFFAKTGNQFQDNVARLYEMAKVDPQGADYWSYFNHDLKRNLKTSTLFTEYRNLLIILTDGYLEAQTNKTTGIAFYTGGYKQRLTAFNKLKAGQPITDALAEISPIMDCSDHFGNLEVLMLEVNGRHGISPQEPVDQGTPRDFDMLKKLWTDWFRKLEIKNASADFFHERLNATELTKQQIRTFIKG